MAEPTALEQYLLELVNTERAQSGAQPLASNSALNLAAEDHSQWMIDADVFSHTGGGGSDPGGRMQAAGYSFGGSSWANAENIAWESTRAPDGYQDEVADLNLNLMNSPEHRANLLNNDLKEIGLGVKVGEFQGWQGAFVTEDFARSGTGSFLTGVVYRDANGTHSYDPGEGLSGVAVDVTNAAGGHIQATTMAAGGYNLALAPGTYTVQFGDGSGVTAAQSVTIGASNVKLDAADPAFSVSGHAAETSVTPPPAAAQPATDSAAAAQPVVSSGQAPSTSSADHATPPVSASETTPATGPDATPMDTALAPVSSGPVLVAAASGPDLAALAGACDAAPAAPPNPLLANHTTWGASGVAHAGLGGAGTHQPHHHSWSHWEWGH